MSRHLRTTLTLTAAVLLIGGALATAVVLQSNRSVHARAQVTELGPGSQAFAQHVDEFANDASTEGPASWADQNYELNGGEAITATDITGAQTAFSVLRKRGVGQGKNSTTT